MTGKFISNLAFLIFVNFLIKPAALFVDASVQNAVGASTYGMFSGIFNFSTLLYILLDFGVTNYNNRSVAQDATHADRYLLGTMVLKAILAVLYVGITYTAATIVGYPPHQMYLLAFMMANQVLLSSVLYLRSNISGMHYFRLDSVLSAFDKLLLLVMVSVLLWINIIPGPFDIRWFVYAQTASLGITAVIAFAFVVSKTGKLEFKWTLTDLQHLLKNTYPYAILGVLMTMYYRIDAVMIDRMVPLTGDYETGAYAAAFRFLDAANNVGLLFATLLLPMFARMIVRKQPVDTLVNTGFKLLFTGSLIVMGMAWFFRQEIAHAIYRQATDYWGDIFGILFLAYGAVCTVYIYGSLLTANGNIKYLNYIALAGCVVNIGLNLILIPQHKALGSAFATLVTQWMVAIVHVLVANKAFKWKTNLPLFGRFFAFVAIVIAVGTFLHGLVPNWKIALPIFLLATTVIAVAIRLFDIREWVQLLKDRAADK